LILSKSTDEHKVYLRNPTSETPPQLRSHLEGIAVGMRWGFLDAAAAVSYAKTYSDPHAAVIRVYDEAGNVIETHEHKGDFTTGP
jgi:hypothetical protein